MIMAFGDEVEALSKSDFQIHVGVYCTWNLKNNELEEERF
jgi:hypothetical protein